MMIAIPADGRVMTILRSASIHARLTGDGLYALTGVNFRMNAIEAGMVFIFPDDIALAEGDAITSEVTDLALPIDDFLAPSAEEAAADALGLVLRAAVADGRVTDEELLRVAPALTERPWKPALAVVPGDVYTHDGVLWKCVQAHTTQSNWTPDATPALWHRVEITNESVTRVWAAAVEYAASDVVAYPDANGARYACVQAHTSLTGWEPPNVPALWRVAD